MSTIFMPKVGTQKLFDVMVSDKTYSNLKDSCGVYSVFHRYGSRANCLYVGLSVSLKTRAARFFKNEFIDAFYLRCVINQIPKHSIIIGVKYAQDKSELRVLESIYIEQLNPMLNIATNR